MNKLKPTSALLLLGVFAASFVISFLVLEMWIRDGGTVGIPSSGFVVPLVISMFVFYEAWQVRKFQAGERTLSPLRAARIWVLTQSASRSGAVLVGFSLGLAFVFYRLAASMTEGIWAALGFAMASLVLTIAGYVGERWCMIDDPEGPGSADGAAGGEAQPA